jgi:hypothetical protein
MMAKATAGTTGGRRVAGRMVQAGRRRADQDPGDQGSHNERVRLITFLWTGRTGNQPVIFADRSWLQ